MHVNLFPAGHDVIAQSLLGNIHKNPEKDVKKFIRTKSLPRIKDTGDIRIK